MTVILQNMMQNFKIWFLDRNKVSVNSRSRHFIGDVYTCVSFFIHIFLFVALEVKLNV